MVAQTAGGRESRDTLTRERVVRAAMDLADESGIESVTMRELGRRLGVEAASLYNHVTGKDDLLDGMVDLVVAEIDTPSGDAVWQEAVRFGVVSGEPRDLLIKQVPVSYKAPRRVCFVSSLPRTASGKVRKADLRKSASSTSGD